MYMSSTVITGAMLSKIPHRSTLLSFEQSTLRSWVRQTDGAPRFRASKAILPFSLLYILNVSVYIVEYTF